MVDVQQTNEKLVVRAQNITMTAAGCSREEAKAALDKAEEHVKTTIVMILLDCDADKARTHLEQAGGHVRGALDSSRV